MNAYAHKNIIYIYIHINVYAHKNIYMSGPNTCVYMYLSYTEYATPENLAQCLLCRERLLMHMYVYV